MLAFVLPRVGQIASQFDLYAVTFYPVSDPRFVVASNKVEIDEVTDDSLYVHGVGARFVGPDLASRGA